MKKKKLKLNDLKVNSFVTNLNANQKATIGGGESVWGICLKSIDGQACNISPIKLGPSAICIPNTYDQGACSELVCGEDTRGILQCNPDTTPKTYNCENEPCSIYRRGSCGGTIGA